MPLMPTLHGFCPLVILQLNSDPLQVKRIYSFLLSGLQMVAKNQKLSLPPMDGLFSMEAKRYGRQRFGNMSREAVHGAVLRNGNCIPVYGRASSTQLIPYCQPRDRVLQPTVQLLFLRT